MTVFVRILGVMCVLSLLCSGCALFKPEEQKAREQVTLQQVGIIRGNVTGGSSPDKPIVVALLAADLNVEGYVEAIIDKRVLYQSGSYHFMVPPGTYFVGAFEDANENFTFQHDEYVGMSGSPDIIYVQAGGTYNHMDIHLQPPEEAREKIPFIYDLEPPPEQPNEVKNKFGIIVTLDDPRFALENGVLGMWNPTELPKIIDSGIYFLEEYDPQKIPVLFVHGAGSTPVVWKSAVAGLDRTHFQPWVVIYPSGFRLEIISTGLALILDEMHSRLNFEHLFVVAHSMGGLVSRGAINHLLEQDQGDMINLLVSMATPWGGHEGATTGVKRSPVIIPSWYDMVPGSPFTKELYERSLPSHMRFFLLFAHRGKYSLLRESNTDGVVSLRSQLLSAAQDTAVAIRGFDESHVDILHSEKALAELHRILQQTRQWVQQP
jgi:pimeloyl-ACP methyl ester carboxylesterase